MRKDNKKERFISKLMIYPKIAFHWTVEIRLPGGKCCKKASFGTFGEFWVTLLGNSRKNFPSHKGWCATGQPKLAGGEETCIFVVDFGWMSGWMDPPPRSELWCPTPPRSRTVRGRGRGPSPIPPSANPSPPPGSNGVE